MNQDSEGQADSRPEGRYANYFEIGHNAFEFLMDFGQCYQESNNAQIHTRIITGPGYAKALSKTLREAIDAYEKVYGPIDKDCVYPNEN